MNRNNCRLGRVHAVVWDVSKALTQEMSLTGATLSFGTCQGLFSRCRLGRVFIYLPYPLGFLLNPVKNFSARWFFLTTS